MRSEFGPIRDQDSVGWCYSFASADLLSNWMYKHAIGNLNPKDKSSQVSAAAVALMDNNSVRKRQMADYLSSIHRAKLAPAISRKATDELTRLEKNKELLEAIYAKEPKPETLDELKELTGRISVLYDRIDRNRNITPMHMSEREGSDSAVAANGLNQMISNGACLERDIPSDDFKFSDPGAHEVANLRGLLKKYESYENDRSEKSLCEATLATQKLFPNVQNVREIKQVLEAFSEADPIETFEEHDCGTQISLYRAELGLALL